MMPQNRTRLWVGLAIVAVTIPAVAQYYYGSPSRTSESAPLEVAARTNDEETSVGRLALQPTDRDYMGEVSSALAKGGAKVSPDSENAQFSTLPLIYSGPLQAIVGKVRPMATPVARYEEEPIDSNAVSVPRATTIEPDDEALDVDEPEEQPQISDRTVYQLVTDNLPEDDRDTFVRAWALMTPEERAALLDEWRANLSN